MRKYSRQRKGHTGKTREKVTVVALYDRILRRITGKYAERIVLKKDATSSDMVGKVLDLYPEIVREFAPMELSIRKNGGVPHATERVAERDRYQFAIDASEPLIDDNELEAIVMETLAEYAPEGVPTPVIQHIVLEKLELRREKERRERYESTPLGHFETPIRSDNGEFLDTEHAIADDYYTVIHNAPDMDMLKEALRELIACDEYYFDPYLDLAEILEAEGDKRGAGRLITRAYKKAIYRMSDRGGNLPTLMRWSSLENRHMHRVIERYAYLKWQRGSRRKALEIFRLLLSINPTDEQGIRYAVLALRMGMASDWNDMFLCPPTPNTESSIPILDGRSVERWFKENAECFHDEFEVYYRASEGARHLS